jgi:hypothetical protein
LACTFSYYNKNRVDMLNFLLLAGPSIFWLPQGLHNCKSDRGTKAQPKLWILTGKSTPVPFLSIMATIATDKSTRNAYATARHKNMSSICKCLTPNSWAERSQHFKCYY